MGKKVILGVLGALLTCAGGILTLLCEVTPSDSEKEIEKKEEV